MFASVFIIIASSLLFLYWFRHTCLLILAQNSEEYSQKVTSTIRLSFPQVQDALQSTPQTTALDRVHASLEDDYRILTDLLQQAVGKESIEHRVLAVDYKAMQVWYKMTRTRDLAMARKALSEMSSILSFFASELGQNASA